MDDIIVTGDSLPYYIQQIIQKLHSTFTLKDLGPLDYFLGIQVKHLKDGSLLLSQSKYIQDLLVKAHMEDAKPSPTPMVSSLKLTKQGADYLEDASLYRSVVGALQYATITRPEISYCVNKVCQFMAQPQEEHWKAVKRILIYLKGTITNGLHIKPFSLTQPLSLVAYCDADWASDPDDRKSTLGSCIFLGGNLISWWSKKLTLGGRSSTEAEYRSLANTSAEILCIESLLTELQIPYSIPIVHCDNQSSVLLAHKPMLHSTTKHVELDIFFVRDKVVQGKLKIVHVPSEFQLADLLTKPLSSTRFLTLKSKLSILAYSRQLC